MKKILFLMGVFLFLLFPLTISAEEITIVGTGSGPPILKEIGRVFSKQHPDITITVPRTIGSGGGIKAVGNDKYLLARVARGIKPEEEHFNLTYTQIARVPIVFYTNQSEGIQNLNKEQILAIFSGKIFNWKEVGGHNGRILVVRRQEGDSSLAILMKSFPNFKNITITEYSKTTYSDPDTIDTVENTPDTIAFGSYADVKNRKVNVLKIDNVSPADPAYLYFGPFALVYKEENKVGSVKKFIDFATSPAAVEAIKTAGGLPLK